MLNLFVRTYRKHPILMSATLGILLLETVGIGRVVADGITNYSASKMGSWSSLDHAYSSSGLKICRYSRSADSCETADDIDYPYTNCERVANGRQAYKEAYVPRSVTCPSADDASFPNSSPNTPYVTATTTILR